MVVIGSMIFEVITSGKVPRLKVYARPYNHETLATEEELLRLSRYLEAEAEKLHERKEG